MAKQDYKIEIILQADVTETPVRDWLTDALSEGHWKYRTLNIYSTDITAIEISRIEGEISELQKLLTFGTRKEKKWS